jgi:hypothetical protein
MAKTEHSGTHHARTHHAAHHAPSATGTHGPAIFITRPVAAIGTVGAIFAGKTSLERENHGERRGDKGDFSEHSSIS